MNDNERENLPSNGLEKRQTNTRIPRCFWVMSTVFRKTNLHLPTAREREKKYLREELLPTSFCQKTFGRRRNSSTKKSRNVGFFSKRLFFFSPERWNSGNRGTLDEKDPLGKADWHQHFSYNTTATLPSKPKWIEIFSLEEGGGGGGGGRFRSFLCAPPSPFPPPPLEGTVGSALEQHHRAKQENRREIKPLKKSGPPRGLWHTRNTFLSLFLVGEFGEKNRLEFLENSDLYDLARNLTWGFNSRCAVAVRPKLGLCSLQFSPHLFLLSRNSGKTGFAFLSFPLALSDARRRLRFETVAIIILCYTLPPFFLGICCRSHHHHCPSAAHGDVILNHQKGEKIRQIVSLWGPPAKIQHSEVKRSFSLSGLGEQFSSSFPECRDWIPRNLYSQMRGDTKGSLIRKGAFGKRSTHRVFSPIS